MVVWKLRGLYIAGMAKNMTVEKGRTTHIHRQYMAALTVQNTASPPHGS
jgi:hypothetical protein